MRELRVDAATVDKVYEDYRVGDLEERARRREAREADLAWQREREERARARTAERGGFAAQLQQAGAGAAKAPGTPRGR